jgi:hypothetical protein
LRGRERESFFSFFFIIVIVEKKISFFFNMSIVENTGNDGDNANVDRNKGSSSSCGQRDDRNGDGYSRNSNRGENSRGRDGGGRSSYGDRDRERRLPSFSDFLSHGLLEQADATRVELQELGKHAKEKNARYRDRQAVQAQLNGAKKDLARSVHIAKILLSRNRALEERIRELAAKMDATVQLNEQLTAAQGKYQHVAGELDELVRLLAEENVQLRAEVAKNNE